MAPAGGKRRTLLDPSDGNNRDRGTLSSPPLCLLGPPPPPPESQSAASGSASGSHHVGVTASSSTPESAVPPTIATGTSQTIEIDADVNRVDDNDERPVKRKKLTSEVWQYFNKEKGSPLQWEELMKCASESGLDTTKGLLNDVSTRWNSTYLMLADAIYYRAAFDRLTSYDRRRYEKMCPSAAEWEKAMKIRAFLKRFFDLTELFSGTLYPTANLFYKGFCDIKIILTDWSKGKDSDITIRRLATAMLAKFDKYWNKSNTALAVASFLDPRFKMRIVQFCMEFIH
ncbi:hypothetical protein OsI_25743 [Oryza sativa Indica Group]|uniref:hAT-like transposase RNase-H fold domain-containing protein n=1 Tax=Oryza sativa subsp. indica TaxID=39946 RepID=B8B5F9_ORYSI|nr:hypothetical protein OsI_25743 [Oryza sativa Indica Group]